MSTVLDTKLTATVIKILNKYGATATVRRVTAGTTYNPTSGEYDASLETGTQNWTVKALPPGQFVRYWQNGEPVLSEQLQSGIQGGSLSFTPEVGDFLLVGSKKWVIDAVWPVYSGDDICLWLFKLKH